ncbi:MAG: hypothetical protein R2688_10855, partial [Fimbriimonadaceae bacterium]
HDMLSIQDHHKRMIQMSFGQIESDVSVEGVVQEIPHEEPEPGEEMQEQTQEEGTDAGQA